MKKIIAFTLAEVLIALMILGVLSVILIKNVKSKSFEEKARVANAYKTIEAIEGALTKMIDLEPNNCPTGAFITRVLGTTTMVYSFVNVNDVNTLVGKFEKYMKFENSNVNFCNNSGTCTSSSTIRGTKLPGDIYVGFELNTGLINCPNYYLPGDTTAKSARTDQAINATEKCWGKVYIDVNGEKAPNTWGQDMYVFGLSATGLSR